MWGYQPGFRIGQESVAKRVFALLDERFQPEIFLVGILAEGKDRFPACVEPENNFWIQSEEFNSTLDIAQKIRLQYPESRMMHSHHLVQQWHDDSLTRRAVRDAVQKVIDAKNSTPSCLSYFVSQPSKVDGYLVCVVLKLQTAILNAYPSLRTNKIPIHECRNISVATSLIDAVVTTYLQKAAGELRLPDPGCDSSSLNAEEILRDAANTMMIGLAYRADQDCIEGWHGLFSECNKIAATYYEKAAGIGTIILASREHPAIQTMMEFTNPTRLRVTRGARKLLQLASQDLALHTDSYRIFGLVKQGMYDEGKENIFKIKFLGHHHWEVSHTGKMLMRVKYGQPYLLKPPFNVEKLRKDLTRIFRGMIDKHIDLIVSLVHEAERKKHGTMLLVTKDAKQEAQRLGNQATPIRPEILTPELLGNLTPIDGAVVLDPEGTCYAIGAILDGMATEEGNPARGARYNSAVRYIATSKHPCIAIVISEDGGVDFIPDLKPAIKQSDIKKAIQELLDIRLGKAINLQKYNKTMNWLSEHRFYMLSSHCRDINERKASIDERIQAEDPTAGRIIWSDFTPNPAMNIDLYYETECKNSG